MSVFVNVWYTDWPLVSNNTVTNLLFIVYCLLFIVCCCSYLLVLLSVLVFFLVHDMLHHQKLPCNAVQSLNLLISLIAQYIH